MNIQNRLRAIGFIILVFGLLVSAFVYSTRLPDEESDDGDIITKRELLQMERIGGQTNVLMNELRLWFVSLWHGQQLAFTLAYVSAGGCGACFFLAQFLTGRYSVDDEKVQ